MATEKRLIDANALLRIFNPLEWNNAYIETAKVVGEINVCPTVEAVEAVRRKDCIHCEQYQREASYATVPICMIHSFEFVDPNDFCSKGERKDNG